METKLTPWKIEWQNDTGPDDDYYIEWYEVSNGVKTFNCDTHEDAELLVKVLCEHSPLLQQRDELITVLKEYMDMVGTKGYNINQDDAAELHQRATELIQKHQI